MANPNIKEYGKATQFKKGQSANPGGKPVGARNELSADFLRTLARDFREHGAVAIEVLRSEKPDVYIKVIAELLPKQEEKTVDVNVNATVEHRSVQEVTERISELLGNGQESNSTPSLPH